MLLALVVLWLLALGYALLPHMPYNLGQQEITKTQLLDSIRQGRVTSIVDEPDPAAGMRTLTGTYKDPVGAAASFKVPIDLQLDPNLAQEIRDAGFKGVIETQNNTNVLLPILLGLLPPLLMLGVAYFLVRQFAAWVERLVRR